MISQMAKPKQREVLSISKWSKNGVRGGLIDHSLCIHRKSSRNRARKQSWLELQKIILQKQGTAALSGGQCRGQNIVILLRQEEIKRVNHLNS